MTTAMQPMSPQQMEPEFPDAYVARRNYFNFFGVTCRILSLAGAVLCWVKLKAFKLKEDIGVFRDAGRTQPLLNIKARQILDFSAAYDVVDMRSGEKVGVLRRKGLKSILKDEWEILDAHDRPLGVVKEDSLLLAMVRRFLSNIVPQTFHVHMGPNEVGVIKGSWNPFIVKYFVDFSADTQRLLDRRLAMATVVLLMTIEGRQN